MIGILKPLICPICKKDFIPIEDKCFTNDDGNIFCPLCSSDLCFRCESRLSEVTEPITGVLICRECAQEMKDERTSPDFEE